ncbi:hypothetical protein M116_1512 [Bacteroides fragilis str. 3719 A10]|jgi:mRNA-degrading endonuclease HigB of HigAB toxin-antitoxin module|nr:hypothetical protein M116_1512 [Bacteroides fragilis str. 3719 A10]
MFVMCKNSDARSVLEEKIPQVIFVIMKNLCLKLQMLWEIAKHRIHSPLLLKDSEIKVDFPTTDYVGNQYYIFNIKGNNYRLIVVVKFTMGYIFIRKVCTHKEYDKIDCSTI